MAPVYRGVSSEDQVARATIRVHRGPLSKFSIQSYVTTGLPGVVAWRASASPRQFACPSRARYFSSWRGSMVISSSPSFSAPQAVSVTMGGWTVYSN